MTQRMRMLFSLCLLLPVNLLAQQLEAHFRLSKERFLAGEPVYLVYEVRNVGPQPVHILQVSPYSVCSGYEFELAGAKRTDRRSCLGGIAGSCVMSVKALKPGEAHGEQILLNELYELKAWGTFELRARRKLSNSVNPDDVHDGVSLETEDHLTLVLERPEYGELERIFNTYVRDLVSSNQNRRYEAALAISGAAPLFLEDTILGMAQAPETHGIALPGLRRLNTPRTRQALAEIVSSGKGEHRSVEAIRYLGEMGDRSYLPLLLEVVRNAKPNTGTHQTSVMAVAELGRDESIPFLLTLLRSKDAFERGNATFALSRTGSRQAVPLLIDLLQSPNETLRAAAVNGLAELTHRASGGILGPPPGNPATLAQEWSVWWSLHGGRAPTYRPQECGQILPLN